jgi:beta-glucosidase
MLGLFDNPFVDEDAAAELVGNATFANEGAIAQRRSMVYLKRPAAPIANGEKVYLYGFSKEPFEAANLVVVDDLDQATIGIIKLQSPSQLLHPGFFFGARQKEGDLDFKEDDKTYLALKQISAKVPTIVVVEMDRPPILTNVVDKSYALLAAFGVNDAATVEVLKNSTLAIGRLPYALPSAMETVVGQSPDRPFDDPVPLFQYDYAAEI